MRHVEPPSGAAPTRRRRRAEPSPIPPCRPSGTRCPTVLQAPRELPSSQGRGEAAAPWSAMSWVSCPAASRSGELRYTWGRGVAGEPPVRMRAALRRLPLLDGRDGPRGATATPASRRPAWRKRIDARLRVRLVPAMELNRARGRPRCRPTLTTRIIAELYHALAASPGAERAIVDSSKLPPYARLLDGLPGVEVFLVHVVRDPRATAFSWRRVKATRDDADAARMPRLSIVRSSVIWLLWNLMVQRWWPDSRRMTVRYEDFVRRPRQGAGPDRRGTGHHGSRGARRGGGAAPGADALGGRQPRPARRRYGASSQRRRVALIHACAAPVGRDRPLRSGASSLRLSRARLRPPRAPGAGCTGCGQLSRVDGPGS